jgi:hypothetical protein
LSFFPERRGASLALVFQPEACFCLRHPPPPTRMTIGMAHSEAFGKACAAGDIPGVLALYEDDATVIWPNEGEIAHGKAEIEKLARALCKTGQPGPKLKSQNSKQVPPATS